MLSKLLNWDFMFKVVENMELGDNFLQDIKLIYTFQKEHIVENRELCKPCEIENKCPLSPLLFILVLAMLNADIRQDKQIMACK